jgi:hypothetical protein
VRQDAERLEDLRADLVLSAVAAVAVASAVRIAWPRFSITSSPLFSSSGCAVVCMKMPVLREMPQREPERDVPLLVVERSTRIWASESDQGEGTK